MDFNVQLDSLLTVASALSWISHSGTRSLVSKVAALIGVAGSATDTVLINAVVSDAADDSSETL